jgi:predicted aspartyl protease
MLTRRTLIAATLPALGWAPAATAMAEGAPAAGRVLTGRFEVVRNRPWTDVTIQGAGPFRFLIDTGATVAVVDPDLAAELKLARLQDAPLRGATAERTVEMFVAQGVIVDSLRQRGAVVFAAGQAGADFQGILPGTMFTAADSEIDFAAREFRIYTGGAPDRAGFTRLPLVRPQGRAPDGRLVVQVRLDGRPANLLIDTGGTGAVLLSGEYVGKNRLWDRYKKWAPGQGQGMLAAFDTRLARAGVLELGGARFQRPPIHLTDPFNPPGDSGDGVLGMDVLRRFTLATDPAGGAIWLKPNAAIGEPFRYNRAGLETGLDGGRGLVRGVTAGGPADRAGVRAGDLIPAVAGPLDLARFDWFLTEEPGVKVEFEVRRGETTLPIRLVLEELL